MLPEKQELLSGLDLADSNAEIARQCRQRIFAHMMKTRGKKYGLFLFSMRSMKYLACQPKRGELLESIYTFMRYLDDVVDGDVSLPRGYASPAEYMQRKIEFANKPMEPEDAADKLLLHSFDLARQIGDDFSSEINDVLQSLHFDAIRRSPSKPCSIPRRDLQHHFHLLDIRGTIGACLKLAREKDMQHTDLQPLGDASRIYYSLQDFDDDIRAGYNNIPIEDAEALGINNEDLKGSSSKGVQEWFHQEAQRGMGMLEEHRKQIPRMSLRFLTKAALWWIFERPAKNFFQQVLHQK